jgi:uncharacterized protein (DUF305 family)
VARNLLKRRSCVAPLVGDAASLTSPSERSDSGGSAAEATTLPGSNGRFKETLTFVAAVAIACAGAGCTAGEDENAAGGTTETGPNIYQPGAPGETGQTLAPEDVQTIETPAYTDADVTFMQNMILHHRQALALAALVPERTGRKDVPLFAERIEISQKDEIKRMEGWLEARGEEPLPYDPDVNHVGHLPGMLSPRDIERLGEASGRRFDLMFLRAMRRHHVGAIAMVEKLQADGGGIEPEISNFTIHVVADQGIEISRINALLAELTR